VAKSCITVCFTYSSRIGIFWTDISQGSVATRIGCGGIFKYDFVTNFLLSQTVKEFRKSVNILWSCGQEFGVLVFLTHSVVCYRLVRAICRDTFFLSLAFAWRRGKRLVDGALEEVFLCSIKRHSLTHLVTYHLVFNHFTSHVRDKIIPRLNDLWK